MTIYSNATLRAVALHAQGLSTSPQDQADTRTAIMEMVQRLFCVQIDTLQMVARSQYLLLWSRIGHYDPAVLDDLTYGADRQLFEYWLKEACLIPLTEYRWCLPRMVTGEGKSGWWQNWLHSEHNSEVVQQVLNRIRIEGGLRAAQFERTDGKKGGGWWDWKPAKRALEYLYANGEVMVGNRIRFQRVYDLRERVLPDWVDTDPPTHDEMIRHYLVRGLRALGIVHNPLGAADYTHTRRSQVRDALKSLIASGEFVPIEGHTAAGTVATWYIHRDDLPLLERAADGAIQPERTCFLTPFDSLFWAAGQDRALFGFRQVLECYKPAPQRIWGYFCLPILHRDTIVGRFDPKLERSKRVLRLKTIHLEPGIEPSPELAASIGTQMNGFMRFHDARELVIESAPGEFATWVQESVVHAD